MFSGSLPAGSKSRRSLSAYVALFGASTDTGLEGTSLARPSWAFLVSQLAHQACQRRTEVFQGQRTNSTWLNTVPVEAAPPPALGCGALSLRVRPWGRQGQHLPHWLPGAVQGLFFALYGDAREETSKAAVPLPPPRTHTHTGLPNFPDCNLAF